MSCAFDGVRNQFHHPLGGGLLRFDKAFESAEIARETDQTIQPVISETSCSNMQANEERWRARFFAHWRLWEPFAVQADYRFGFLPADTRLPDHTIWNHMQVASALAGCAESDAPLDRPAHPASPELQLGPVQDFIAQARSIRDQWSGSFLLSWRWPRA